MYIRTLAAIAMTTLTLSASAAKAESFSQKEMSGADLTHVEEPTADRLLIVNGSNGRVIYDDGHDDLFCVTRKVVVGYDDWGQPIRKRTMRCR